MPLMISLLDQEGNQIAFTPAGQFAGVAVAPERPLVRSLSHGTQTVSFHYTLDQSGELRIASARLADGSGGVPYVVRYQYDDEGRLARVSGPARQVAELQYQRVGGSNPGAF